MTHDPENPDLDIPQFVESPEVESIPDDRPGMAQPVAAPTPVTPRPPAVAPRQPTTSVLSSALLMIVGGAIAAGGYGLARVFAPPGAPGEVNAGKVAPLPPDVVKPEDLRSLAERVDQLKAAQDRMSQSMANQPSIQPEIDKQNDRIDQVARKVDELPTRFDSIEQKMQTIAKFEPADARIESLNKRIDDLAREANARTDESKPVATNTATPADTKPAPTDVNVEGEAMEQAADLFEARKYAEARDAFVKLQTVYPDDARVWYYSALANGFATGEWRGETERMVNVGLVKEKAGRPDSAKVDAVFANLTSATGKDWLAGYRQRIGAR